MWNGGKNRSCMYNLSNTLHYSSKSSLFTVACVVFLKMQSNMEMSITNSHSQLQLQHIKAAIHTTKSHSET